MISNDSVLIEDRVSRLLSHGMKLRKIFLQAGTFAMDVRTPLPADHELWHFMNQMITVKSLDDAPKLLNRERPVFHCMSLHVLCVVMMFDEKKQHTAYIVQTFFVACGILNKTLNTERMLHYLISYTVNSRLSAIKSIRTDFFIQYLSIHRLVRLSATLVIRQH